MTPPSKGDKVLCWWPDFAARPWRATVIEVRARKPEGLLIAIEGRGPCPHCRYLRTEARLTLGEEWFDREYARRARASGRKAAVRS